MKGKRKKEDEETARTEPSEERKKKRKEKKRGSKVAAESDSGTRYMMLFTKMPLKTELWKLKTHFMYFQFP